MPTSPPPRSPLAKKQRSLSGNTDSYRGSIRQALIQGRIDADHAKILADVALQIQQTLLNFENALARKFSSLLTEDFRSPVSQSHP
jgi:hypothetical protein